MISTTQREALALIAEICDLSPDVRLGQLLAHIGFLGEDQTGRTLWDIDDEQLLAVLYHHRDELTSRSSDPAVSTPTLQAIMTPDAQVPSSPLTPSDVR